MKKHLWMKATILVCSIVMMLTVVASAQRLPASVLEKAKLEYPSWMEGTLEFTKEAGFRGAGEGLLISLQRIAEGSPFWADIRITFDEVQDWSAYGALSFYIKYPVPEDMLFTMPEVAFVESSGATYISKGTGGMSALTIEYVDDDWFVARASFTGVYRPGWSAPDDNDQLDLDQIKAVLIYPCVMYSAVERLVAYVDYVQLVP